MQLDRRAVLQCFQAECDEKLAEMEQSLVALEGCPNDEELLHTVFRIAHTIKGNALALDFAALAEFTHAIEDLLEDARKHSVAVTSGFITLLLRAADAIRKMMNDGARGAAAGSPEATELRELIVRMHEGQDSDAPAVKPVVPRETSTADSNSARRQTQSLRVDLDKLDRMVNLAGEIAIARGRLTAVLQQLQGTDLANVLDIHREADFLHAELQELVMHLRMVPLGPTFRHLERVVRDLARASGKAVRFEASGHEVELDTRVIELIRDPLMHMVRNAVDHGIETAASRHRAGKDACGVVGLRAYHSAGNVVIEVVDDGAGFNRERILTCARERGLIGAGEKVSDSDIYRVVFEPGFSTAGTVTDLSGRGVGMDVVRRNIDALRGSVTVTSTEGRGATIMMRIPLTLAIIDGFSVAVGDETYVLPLDSVVECLEMPAEQHRAQCGGVIELRGGALPYVRLRSTFGLDDLSTAREQIVVVKHEGGMVGLAVDTLIGETQAVVKPLGALVRSVQCISGATILGDGRVALIVDVGTLVREAIRNHAQAVGSA